MLCYYVELKLTHENIFATVAIDNYAEDGEPGAV